MSDVGAKQSGPRGEHDAAAEPGDRPAAAAGAGASIQDQHSPDGYTALLPEPGVCKSKEVMKPEHNGPSSLMLSHFCVQVKENQNVEDESTVLSELQSLKEQLEKSEEDKKALETQLSEANSSVTQLQEEGSCRPKNITPAVTAEKCQING